MKAQDVSFLCSLINPDLIPQFNPSGVKQVVFSMKNGKVESAKAIFSVLHVGKKDCSEIIGSLEVEEEAIDVPLHIALTYVSQPEQKNEDQVVSADSSNQMVQSQQQEPAETNEGSP